ncbi:protein phosphatase 2C domain-containing protein [Streptomyces sp. NPDC001851]|uniref:protein phosphatase 2C domain-containing protein n=1 Tax=Streptomyces sp. NPDC001851 TaxID=3154529 RepID=UPI0033314A71
MIVAGASVQGTAHLATGQGCQDAFKAVDLGDTAVLAVSDGAGSRDRSALGAHIAVDAACRLLAEDIPDAEDTPQAWTAWIAGRGKRVAEEYLRAVTGVLGTAGAQDPGALAATVTASVVRPPWAAFLSLGDCFGTLLTRDGRCHLVLPPPTGPTPFLSSPGAALRLRSFVVWEPELDGVVLATDGCAALTLDHPSVHHLPAAAGPLPAGGFFLGLAATLRENHGDAEPLRRRLAGPEAGRTGDDLTVLCALVEGG